MHKRPSQVKYPELTVCLSSANSDSGYTRHNMGRREAAQPPSNSYEIPNGFYTWQSSRREFYSPSLSAEFYRRNEPHLRVDQGYSSLVTTLFGSCISSLSNLSHPHYYLIRLLKNSSSSRNIPTSTYGIIDISKRTWPLSRWDLNHLTTNYPVDEAAA